MLTKQIKDDTIHWVHLNLFCDWIFQDPDNFTLASQYIRELSLDQASTLPTLDIVRLITRVELRHFSHRKRQCTTSSQRSYIP